MSDSFIHLHVHMEGSIYDSALRSSEATKKAKELGMSAIALTDHGNMYQVINFYKDCEKQGIKPIIGMETYIAPRGNRMKEGRDDAANYHLVLLCETNEGYQNLMKIASDAALDGMYYHHRTDYKHLREWHSGLIALSACLGGEVQKYLTNGDYEKAKETALIYDDIFGRGNFFLELQDHGMPEQKAVNPQLIKLSRETGIPLVATNDCHYLTKDSFEAHDVLMAMQAKTTVDDDKRKRYPSDQFYLKTQEEMWKLFSTVPEALENTVKIADRCNVKIEFGANKMPPFPVPEPYTSEGYLMEQLLIGVQERYGEITPELQERLDYEFSTVKRMGYLDYFLIVWDLFRFARERDIFCGPGRGCFLPDSKILLASGILKNIQDVIIGDRVVTHTGEVQPVEKCLRYNVGEKITNITLAGTKNIHCTSDHKILALKTAACNCDTAKYKYCTVKCNRHNRCRYSVAQEKLWIRADDLKRGDFVTYPKPLLPSQTIELFDLVSIDSELHHNSEFIWYERGSNNLQTDMLPRYIPINEETSLLFGYFIGNGWSRIRSSNHNYEVGIAFSAMKLDDVRKCEALMIKYLNKSPSWRWNKKGTCVQLIIASKAHALLFKSLFGNRALNKRIPDELMVKNELNIKALLTGLMKTDGHFGRNGDMAITYSSTSESLVSQIKMLFAHLGYYGSMLYRKHNVVAWHDEIKLKLSGKQLIRMKEELFADIEISNQKYFRNDFLQDDEAFYFRVMDVTHEDYSGYVYDLSVPGNTSYVVNQTAVHNSGAGSMMLYALGVTHVEPIQYGLLFERFLDPSRISMPDVDTDWPDDRRQEVIDYIIDKYGSESCCQIITFGRMQAKRAIGDVSRALGIEQQDYLKISKLIPNDLKITIQKALNVVPELKAKYEEVPWVKHVLDIAMQVEGLPGSISTHAAGMLVADRKGLREHVPLCRTEKGIVAQYAMGNLEDIGMLKLDLLGLNTLKIVVRTLALVYKNYGVKINPYDLYACDDLKVLEVVKNGWTEGIFQLESPGMTNFMKELGPSNIEEVTAGVALYRPGPMDMIPQYIAGKRDADTVHYDFPELEPIFKETYGVMVYQEQCMKSAIAVAGYQKHHSDSLRKAISKKKEDLMRQHRTWFIDGREKDAKQDMIPGGVNTGHNRDQLMMFFDKMEKFGSYSFNKCIAGTTKIQRLGNTNSRFQPTIEEMFKIKNDREYARATKHIPLYQKYRYNGYGNALSMYSDGRIRTNKIVDIYQSGYRDVYEVMTSSGAYIVCTDNHKFPTPVGEKMLSELSIGSQLYVSGIYELTQTKYNLTNGDFERNLPHKGQCGFQTKKYAPSKDFNERRKSCHDKKLPCSECGAQYEKHKRFELHHEDLDRTNNSDQNLTWLCNRCHKKKHYKHGRMKVFEKGLPVNIEEITSIRYQGRAMTYDVEMADPAHNFISESGLVTSNSHAACYAVIAYVTAWLKYYYPCEFMAVNMDEKRKDQALLARYLRHCESNLAIEIIPPSINSSEATFNPFADRKIAFSLSVRDTTSETLKAIIDERDRNGMYCSMIEFIERTWDIIDLGTFKGLAYAGAFDELNIHRSSIIAGVDDVMRAIQSLKGAINRYQSNPKTRRKERPKLSEWIKDIDDFFPKIHEFPDEIRLRKEKEYIGIYITGHPLNKFACSISTFSNFELADFTYEIDEDTGSVMLGENIRDGKRIQLIAQVTVIKQLLTKKDKIPMAALELEDLTGSAKAVIFPKAYAQYSDILKEEQIYRIKGQIKSDSDESPSIIVNEMSILEDDLHKRIIFHARRSQADSDEFIRKIIAMHCYGNSPVYIKFGHTQILLKRKYWVDVELFTQKCSEEMLKRCIINEW